VQRLGQVPRPQTSPGRPCLTRRTCVQKRGCVTRARALLSACWRRSTRCVRCWATRTWTCATLSPCAACRSSAPLQWTFCTPNGPGSDRRGSTRARRAIQWWLSCCNRTATSCTATRTGKYLPRSVARRPRRPRRPRPAEPLQQKNRAAGRPVVRGPKKQRPLLQGPKKQRPRQRGPKKQRPRQRGPKKQRPRQRGRKQQRPVVRGRVAGCCGAERRAARP